MKKLLAALFLLTSSAFATTTITDVNVSYANSVVAAGQPTGMVDMAYIGGQVAFTGAAPVFVTIEIGGQIYSQPTDLEGYFSFFVFSNGAGEFRYSAWAPTPSDCADGCQAAKTAKKTFVMKAKK